MEFDATGALWQPSYRPLPRFKRHAYDRHKVSTTGPASSIDHDADRLSVVPCRDQIFQGEQTESKTNPNSSGS